MVHVSVPPPTLVGGAMFDQPARVSLYRPSFILRLASEAKNEREEQDKKWGIFWLIIQRLADQVRRRRDRRDLCQHECKDSNPVKQFWRLFALPGAHSR